MRVMLLFVMVSYLAMGCDEDGGSPADLGGARDMAGGDWTAVDQGEADLPGADAQAVDLAIPDNGTPDLSTKVDGAPASCTGIKKAVTDEIARNAKCTATSECTFIYGICPFGCHIPHNKTADLAKYKAALAAFQASSLCQKCTYKCTKPGTLACTAGKCVMSYP